MQQLAQRFEARVQHVEMGSDVKAGGVLEWGQLGEDYICMYDKYMINIIHIYISYDICIYIYII